MVPYWPGTQTACPVSLLLKTAVNVRCSTGQVQNPHAFPVLPQPYSLESISVTEL